MKNATTASSTMQDTITGSPGSKSAEKANLTSPTAVAPPQKNTEDYINEYYANLLLIEQGSSSQQAKRKNISQTQPQSPKAGSSFNL